MDDNTSLALSSKFLCNKIKLTNLYKLNILWAKLVITQLALIIASIYTSRVIGQHGALQYSGYSLVSQINLTSYVIIMISLQPIYFLAGQQLGKPNPTKYNYVIWAGLVATLLTGIFVTILNQIEDTNFSC